MNPLDIGILLMVGFSGVRGLRRGFVRGVADLLVWLAALAVASRFWPTVARQIGDTALAPVASPGAFAITFFIAIGLLGAAANAALAATRLLPRIPPFGFLNSVLGIAPGVVKGAMMVSVLLAPLLGLEQLLGEQSPLADSVLARPVVAAVDGLTNGAMARAGIDPGDAPAGMPLP